MLATIEQIAEIRKHPNADRLDIVRVLGWDCIVGRGNHQPGDVVLLIQPDSVLPADRSWCANLLQYVGSKNRVKAVKLRGEWSMGLVVPLSEVPIAEDQLTIGAEFSELLGIVKYEAPAPRDLKAKGGLPFGLPKTDEEKWQNLVGHAKRFAAREGEGTPFAEAAVENPLHLGETVDVTLKIDGSSFTAYCALPIHFPLEMAATGICSRSLELKTDETNGTNPWLEAARLTEVLPKLAAYCVRNGVSLALRGEVYGPGVQTLSINPYCRKPRGVAFFSVWNLAERRYEGRESPHYYQRVCADLGLPVVPLIAADVELTEELIRHYGDTLDNVGGEPFEGVVIKGADFSFKIVNKWYDSKK